VNAPTEDEWLSVGKIATVLHVSVQTVRNYCGLRGAPQLVSIRTAGGHRRISLRSAEALLRRWEEQARQIRESVRL
jgi:hypothetical protein